MNKDNDLSLRLKQYILELSGKSEQEIDFERKLSLIEDLELDSIEIVELIVFIEDELGLKCDSDELIDKLDDVDELIKFITSVNYEDVVL